MNIPFDLFVLRNRCGSWLKNENLISYLVRSFTIPTPESSPSSCTSDVLHPHHLQAAGGVAAVSIPSSMTSSSAALVSAHLGGGGGMVGGLEARYSLPTPDVSPMDGGGQARAMLEYPPPPPPGGYQLNPHDRFNFESAPLPGKELNSLSWIRCPC